jgi:protein-S-isoprenylcysteine O-methyltransferase Ste14
MSNIPVGGAGLLRRALGQAAFGFGALAALLFLSAGTLWYWQAWIYLWTVMAGTLVVGGWLYFADRELFERRTRTGEKEPAQRWFGALFAVDFVLLLLLAGLDRRLGWSRVPAAAVLGADLIVVIGYGLFARVLRENSYASRIIEVHAGQRVISTGPYRWVRHPMYSAAILWVFAAPVALGSFWALVPALALPFVLALRIRNEEEVLARGLPGYSEYMERVRHRIIPGVW